MLEIEPWELPIERWVAGRLVEADSGHDLEHVRRVVANARSLTASEPADPRVVLPAAWLHDCVVVDKSSPLRSQASRLAAEQAVAFLRSIGYPESALAAIAHCIEAHSFTAAIACRTIEARVIQDADRLEALGAIGIARCLMTGGAMRQRLYCPDDPFPWQRSPDEAAQVMDHFFTKLLRLADSMQTPTGRRLATERTEFMKGYLRQLALELGLAAEQVESAIVRCRRPSSGDRQ